MNRSAHATTGLWFPLCAFLFVGCSPSPGKLDAARQRVVSTPSAAVLAIDEPAISEIIAAETSDPQKTTHFKGAVVQAMGLVKKVNVERSE